MSDKSLEWLLAHKSTIGSTASSTVVGLNPYQDSLDLWDDMLYAIEQKKVISGKTNGDMQRGILTEPLHRDLLSDVTGLEVFDHDQDDFVVDQNKPWAHTLPDGWVMFEGKRVPLQLKCPRPQGFADMKLNGIHDYWLLGTQHSMAITKCDVEYFSVLNPVTMELLHFPIYRDDTLINDLMEIEEKFFDSLKRSTRPEETPLLKVHLPPGELVVIDSEEAIQAASSYLLSREILLEAEALQGQAKNRLKALMGDAHVVQLPGLRCYNTQCDGRASLDTDKMIRAGINVDEFIKIGKPYTHFRAYPYKEQK